MVTSPPLPPSPPLGPPRGTYFSRRKARQPLPPLPALTRIVTSSINTKGYRREHWAFRWEHRRVLEPAIPRRGRRRISPAGRGRGTQLCRTPWRIECRACPCRRLFTGPVPFFPP